MNEISIRIFWGPWGGEINPSPVVSLGNVVGSIAPTAPVLVKEDKSWMIRTDEWKAVYSCHSKERSFNSDSYMQLLVCVIIPKGKRLSGEKSPLDLLEDIRNQFDLLFTIDIDAVLPPKEEVEAAFTQVLSDYVVVDCPWYVYNMEGKEPASFQVDSRSQLNALMRFNAYPALAHVEHLELGFKCDTTVDINTKGESNGGSKKENTSKWWKKKDKEKEPKEEPTKKPEKEKPAKKEDPKIEKLVVEENINKGEMKRDVASDFGIALYIAGTKWRYASFGFIMGVGVLAGNEHEGDMMDIVPVSRASTDENPIITIKNADGYVLYKLWDDSIETCDIHGKGRLAIGITIPSQARLRGNKSPYRLLMDIYEKFLVIGTEKTEDGMTKFRDVDLDKAEFVKIIESYPLEEANIKPAVMKGDTIGEIQMSPEKMEDFFRDTQYSEFAHYKAIEVTTKGKNMFPSLEIPRPVSYEVFVDGDTTNTFLKDRNDRYTARKIASENYKYDSLSFSLGELLDIEEGTKRNQTGTVVVKLDKNNRRIDCTMKPWPILYKIRVGYSDHSDDEAKKAAQKYLKDGSLRIRLDGKDLDYGDAAIKPSDAKAAVKDNDRFDVYPKEGNGYVFSVAKARLDEYNEEVVITLKATMANDDRRGGGHIGSKRKYWIIVGIVGLVVGFLARITAANILENKRNKQLVTEEILAYHDAIASSDTTMMKNYLDAYSAPQFKYPNQRHLSDIQQKLDEARKEADMLNKEVQAEEAAYSKCKDETQSLDERIDACETYLEAKYTKNKNEIEQLKETLTAERMAGDNAEAEKDMFDSCKNAQSQAYPANYKACQTYLRNYPTGANKAAVDEYINDIMKGRDDILKLLNRRDRAVFRNNYGDKWRKYITIVEFNAVESILDYRITQKDHRREVLIRKEIKDYFESRGGLKFKNWDEVMKVKREIDMIVSTCSDGNE